MLSTITVLMLATICPVESACFEIPLPEVYVVEPYKPQFSVIYEWEHKDYIKGWWKRGCACRNKPKGKPPHVPEPTTIAILGLGGLLLRRFR